MSKIKAFIKKEPVFFISALCALGTMVLVPPDKEYLGYIDFRVLCLLFCLMAVVAGFKSVGMFNALTYQLLSKIKSGKALGVTLVVLPFFSSMLVTNDVALIIFIPFTISLIQKSECKNKVVPIIVLQTVAANLGSMLTPIGNPQNLYLYNLSQMGLGEFILCMLPNTLISFVLLVIGLFFIKGKNDVVTQSNTDALKVEKKQTIIYLILFVLSLMVVAKVIAIEGVLAIVLVVVFTVDKEVLKTVHYCLLFTFISFFIFTGNLGNIPAIRETLQALVNGRELIVGVAASQAISNVPAALLLSGFTNDYRALLAGVNIGGLGTLIASMASLISYKILANHYDEKKGSYFKWFTIVNVLFLVVLLVFNF